MYTFRLTEEIARWAFEINFNTTTEWKIAFTNPTAGPWKTIKAPSLTTGIIGEVYRFELEETRPDILLFNDRLKHIIIIEAKDSLEKLLAGEQIKKTIEVVDQLSVLLSQQSHNQFWAGRESYDVITGLLWGCEKTHTNQQYEQMFSMHYKEMNKHSILNKDFILGIETVREGQNLRCVTYAKCYHPEARTAIDAIARSMNLPVRALF